MRTSSSIGFLVQEKRDKTIYVWHFFDKERKVHFCRFRNREEATFHLTVKKNEKPNSKFRIVAFNNEIRYGKWV